MKELVNGSDLIVIGTIGEIVDKRQFYGYQRGTDLLAKKDLDTPFSLGLPLVDFSINIQEIIMDDDKSSVSKSKDVILRVFESDDELSSENSLKDKEGTMIFFLTRTPDGKAYGVTSLMHKVRLDNPKKGISYTLSGKAYNIPFAEKLTPSGFVDNVKNQLKNY